MERVRDGKGTEEEKEGEGFGGLRTRFGECGLLLGIDFRKLSARHKHNRTSRDF